MKNNNINCNEVAKAYVVLQKYTEALELNAYDAETYLKRAAAYMKLSNNQGIWSNAIVYTTCTTYVEVFFVYEFYWGAW